MSVSEDKQEWTLHAAFRRFAQTASFIAGSPWAFVIAVCIVLGWVSLGPAAHYSDTWQLVINTGTTIVTFLMVFLIQNSQNRDVAAIQMKLNELIRAMKGARTGLVDLESATDEELVALEAEFKRIRERNQNSSAKT